MSETKVTTEATENPETKPETAPEKTFTQAELDAILDKRLARERKDTEARIKAAATEAEKLARMNAEERARHDAEARDGELRAREAELTKRELRAEAINTLAEKGIPRELADILPYTDADTTNAALTAVEKAFRAAVEKGVTDRLKGEPPKANTQKPQGDTVQDEIRKAVFGK